MNDSLSPDPDALVLAFATAFPRYIAQRLAELGVTPDEAVDSAVQIAASQLESSLRELMSLPADEQVESPLELVRRATEPVTAALDRSGADSAQRDEWQSEAHPDDRYSLYPASSLDLGEDAWHVHLEWGKMKARAVAGMVPAATPNGQHVAPAVVLFGVPQEGRDQISTAVENRGYRPLVWRNPAALAGIATERPVAAVVALDHPAAHDAIRSFSAAGATVVATSPAVNDLMMPGIMALGASVVVESAGLLARLDSVLPDIV